MKQLKAELMDTEAMIVSLYRRLKASCRLQCLRHHRLARRNRRRSCRHIREHQQSVHRYGNSDHRQAAGADCPASALKALGLGLAAAERQYRKRLWNTSIAGPGCLKAALLTVSPICARSSVGVMPMASGYVTRPTNALVGEGAEPE